MWALFAGVCVTAFLGGSTLLVARIAEENERSRVLARLRASGCACPLLHEGGSR